jgi:nucleotide-binding universal stress UspA family protein
MAIRVEPAAWDPDPLAPVLARNILVAIDGSPGAERALEYAVAVAQAAHGRLTLLSVVPHERVPPSGLLPGYDPRQTELDWACELRAAADGLPQDIPVTLLLARGSAVAEIVLRAECGCHDLVVVGCQGRGPLHGALGGVSQRVLRRCSVPVQIVRSPDLS